MVGHYKIRNGPLEPTIMEEEDDDDDFDMFEEEEELEGGPSSNGSGSNILTFYPYANNKMTRSVGTLNLSLSNTALGDHKQVDDSSVDEYIDRWSPFNDESPSTPTTADSKRKSKHEMSPFINDPEITKKWRRKPTGSKLALSWAPIQELHEHDQENSPPRNLAVPDQTAFLAPTGLVSKVAQSSFPKKLSIPDTPVKKSPLMENSRLSNSICGSPNFSNRSYNMTQETSLHMQSPSFNSIPQLMIDASPLINPLSEDDNERGFKVRHEKLPPQFHVSRYKKIKKSRNSVIMNNNDLTNSLQQFTDDLYGTDNNDQRTEDPKSDDLSYFSILPPPKGSKAYQNDASCSSTDTTPTRKKSILNAKTKAIESSNKSTAESSPKHTRRFINAKVTTNPDSHLFEKFTNVSSIGDGQFSTVYQVTFQQTNKKYAVKAIQPSKHSSIRRILQEVKILSEISESVLDQEGKEYVIGFISSWKHQGSFYIMTEYCENGTLDSFLQEQIVAKKTRLEDWRIWKIIVELSLALRFIHDSCHIVHLDLKPANILITFEGNLKLADFGMATHLPLEDFGSENEGDREYIAPEIISDCVYDFKADIFSLGLVVVEIAANVVLPDNGNAWHKLRSGDLSDAGRLSANDIHSESLFSDNSKVDTNLTEISDYHDRDTVNLLKEKSEIPPWVPRFLIDGESLERMVKWMIEPNYKKRPTANEILHTEECIYVEMTRQAGAIIQEDDFGPKPGFFAP
ncbi:tyrosine protein kinase SWE1 TDEL_0F02980 [Torulaspora delbrueckii]|uniref:Protein kinase domain-containing protein n=1 Tax=Torulaspora delbrueckii TaxID=4950 RepID=G8ZWW5_TORDE|nr:hypothetical protein TDEL_0F02980 [Torulaspora delbrueckii]CCE93109.1 hypothetical protein TDEL_0F02980 [Torulaspora delbrueckii]